MKPSGRLLRPLPGALFLGLSTLAMAQTPSATTGGFSTSVGAPSNLASTSDSNPGRDWIIRPRVSLVETLTDNANINRSNNQKQGDLITEIAPGLLIEARTARLKAYFDYALRGQIYARESDYNQTQNSLNTFGTLEAVNQWLFVDFSGRIAQQAISAFGAQSPSNSTINNNYTETASYRVSPYIRGRLGGLVEYLLRYNLSSTQSDANLASDSNIAEWVGQLRGSTPFQALRWSIDANQQSTDYSSGRDTDAERLRAMLTYTVLPQLRVSASGGQETNNYASLDQETNSTYGFGFDWTPTERTQVSAFKERRFFGDGHNLSLSHRFPRSSIRISDTKDISVLPNQYTTTGLGTVYDLYYQIYSNVEPYASMDPAIKDAAVASVVNSLLAQSGISGNTQVTSGELRSYATLQRNQSLALAIFGARNTLTLLLNRTENQSVYVATATSSNATTVRQEGASLNLSHRLGALSNLNVLVSYQQSTGNSNLTQNNNLKTTTTTYQLGATTKLGAKTSGSLSARRTEFDSTTNPYTENALLGTLSYVY